MKLKFHLKPGQIFSDLWKRFAPSALVCLLLAAVGIFQNAVSTFASEAFRNLCDTPVNYALAALVMSLLFATAASCVCERYTLRKFIAWIAAAVGAGVGALFVWVSIPELIPVGIILFCLALCLHSVSGKEHPSVRISQVCGWFFMCLGISIVMFYALMLCSMAVFELFFQNVSYKIQGVVESALALLTFFVFAPWLFLGGVPKEDTPLDKRSGFRKFAYVVLLPLYLLLLGILLAYIAKIAVTLTMPVGVMNSYGIAALTLFVFFHLTLDGTENRLSQWFAHWGGLLLVPVVAVQGIGVWMRVSAYGLTESRVLGLVWTALCIAVVLTALLRKRANWFFLTSGVIALVLFCTPISAENAAIMNQEHRLRTALTESDMFDEQGDIIANAEATLENREIIYSSADYLYHETAREGSLTHQLQTQIDAIRHADGAKKNSVPLSDAKALLFGFAKPEETDSDWYSRTYGFYGTAVESKVEVRGYAYAKWISIWQYGNYVEASETSTGMVLSEDKTELESAEPSTFYGTTDIAALVDYLEANRASGDTLNLPVPVTFMIDGEMVDLTALLNGTYLADDQTDLPTDYVILPSGKKLHINRLRVTNYSDADSDDYISLYAWLLTPDTEAAPAN